MSQPPRVVFAGTPEFAVPSLRALLGAGCELAAVYTQPDRPAGRGRRLTPSPVKRLALERGLPVEQPESLRPQAARERLAALAPDVIVVVAYGLILPRRVLGIPAAGCLNVHASLLPRWRGAAPVQRALLAGDRETGVCVMRMEPGLDTGPVLARRSTPIGPRDTGGSLHDRLSELGAELLVETLPAWLAGAITAEPQPETGVTYAAKIEPREAWLDWSEPAAALERQVRAFEPWPVARTRLHGEDLRIREADCRQQPAGAIPGTVVAVSDAGIEVATGDGRLRLTRLQRPGRRPQPAAEFLRGHPLEPGERLG